MRQKLSYETTETVYKIIGLNESLFYKLRLFRLNHLIWHNCTFHWNWFISFIWNWFISFFDFAIFFQYYDSSFIKPCFIAEASAIQNNKCGLTGIAIAGRECKVITTITSLARYKGGLWVGKSSRSRRGAQKMKKKTGGRWYSTVL